MKRAFLRSIAGQSLWEIQNKLCRFAAIILIARHLGVLNFGNFALVVTFIEIMNVVADFKLDPGLIRGITNGEFEEQEAFNHALALKIAAGLITLLCSFPIFFLLAPSIERLIDLSCAASVLLFWQITSFTRPVFQLHGILEKFTFARAIAGLFMLGIMYFIMILHVESVRIFLLAYACSFLIESSIAIGMCSHLIHLRLSIDIKAMKNMALEGMFFSIMNALVVFYYKIDTLLMGVFRGSEALGVYNAAYRLIDVSMFVPMAVAAVVYPEMLRKGVHEPAGWSSGQKALDLLMGFVIPLCLLTYCARVPLIEITYGQEFIRASTILGILVMSMLFLYPSAILCQALIVTGKDKILMQIHAGTALLSIPTYWITIEKFGLCGAAWTTVMLQAIVFTAALYFTKKEGATVDFYTVIPASVMSIPIIIITYLISKTNFGTLSRLILLTIAIVPAFWWLFRTTMSRWTTDDMA